MPSVPTHPHYAELFVGAAEAAVQVRDRHQFFLWLQFHLQRFVPHELVMFRLQLSPNAGSVVHLFNSVPLSESLLALLATPECRLWRTILDARPKHGHRPFLVSLDGSTAGARPEEVQLRAAGLDTLTVHGEHSRSPGQPEIVFAFFTAAAKASAAHCVNLELWLPYLQFGALRAFATATPTPGVPATVVVGRPQPGRALLTDREVQILQAVRQARRNAEIGAALGISPATVKNHLRKIMGKLGARNRAHAVAEAISRRLIS